MKRKTELYGGKYDGKPIEVDSYIREILIPDISVDIDYELEFGDPDKPFEMKNILYKLDNSGRYTPFYHN